MNTHVGRWKSKYNEVQKVLDALPESGDQTVEAQVCDKKSLTVSENQSQDFEENKDGEKP